MCLIRFWESFDKSYRESSGSLRLKLGEFTRQARSNKTILWSCIMGKVGSAVSPVQRSGHLGLCCCFFLSDRPTSTICLLFMRINDSPLWKKKNVPRLHGNCVRCPLGSKFRSLLGPDRNVSVHNHRLLWTGAEGPICSHGVNYLIDPMVPDWNHLYNVAACVLTKFNIWDLCHYCYDKKKVFISLSSLFCLNWSVVSFHFLPAAVRKVPEEKFVPLIGTWGRE